MKNFRAPLLVPVLLAAALLVSPLRGQDATPATAATPEKPAATTTSTPKTPDAAVTTPAASTATPDQTPSVAPANPPAPVAEPAPADTPKVEEAKPAAPAPIPEAAKEEKSEATDEDEGARSDAKVPGIHISKSRDGDEVRVADDVTIPEGVTVNGDAVSVMGDLIVDGEVTGDAVAVMGDNTINGHVHQNIVAVMGDLNLGPKAVVDGNMVCVGGEVHRDPGAKVAGKIVRKQVAQLQRLEDLFGKTLRMGRPLAIGAHLGWLWMVTAFSIGFYALLALLFPNAVRRCGDKIVLEPWMTIFAAILSLIGLPVLFILLCITVVGIPIALFLLPVTVLVTSLFGKASIYALIGRKITSDRYHLAVATIIGALVFVLLYLVPFAGLLLAVLVWFVGFGSAVLTMFASRSKPAAAPKTPPAAALPAPAPATVPAAVATPPIIIPESTAPVVPPEMAPPVVPLAAEPAPSIAAVPPVVTPPPAPAPVISTAAPALPPVLEAMTLPRAGFWIRLAAAALDFFLVAMTVMIVAHTVVEHSGPGLLFLSLGVYSAALWKSRGSTIGGIICGLKVVRLDGRPIDWQIAIVRALAAALSFMVAGLGFIWVAIDPEKQSWHDKVAGTTIVRVPKGTALV